MTVEHSENEEIEQRKQHKKNRRRGNKRPRLRLIPIWLRLIVIAIFCMLSLLAGMMFGFGVIGDGDPFDALRLETWQHIVKLMNGVE